MRASLCLLLPALLLGACAPFHSPLEPDIKTEGGKLHYRGEAAINDVAYQYALETREEFSSALNHIQGFQEGSSAAALGLGAGTGAAVAFGGSTTLLKGLALGAGGLLGLRELGNSGAKAPIYQRGIEAIDCAVGVTSSIKEGAEAASVKASFAPNLAFLSQAETSSNERLQPALDALARAQTLQQKLQTARAFEREMELGAATRRARESLMRLMIARNDLRAAVRAAAANASSRLAQTVREIKAEVRKQLLAAVPDPSGILDRMRDSIGSKYQDYLKKRQENDKAEKDFKKAAVDVAAADTGTEAGLTTLLGGVADLLAADEAALDKIEGQLDACVGKLNPPAEEEASTD